MTPRRCSSKRCDSELDCEVEVLRKLRAAAEIDRDQVVFGNSIAGIGKLQLPAAQRQCNELGRVYTVLLAQATAGKDSRAELIALKKREPDWFLNRRIDSFVNSAGFF